MEFLSAAAEFLWGVPATALLIFSGIFLSVKLKFFHIKNFRKWLKKTAKGLYKTGGKEGGVSAVSALLTALGASVGVGNIAGVASAIMIGGAGSVFWLWVAAFFGMIISFCENALGYLYRKEGKNGAVFGGPMYYIRRAFRGKGMAILFASFCFLASFGVGNMSQSKAIAENLNAVLKIPFLGRNFLGTNLLSLILGGLLALLIGIVLFGGDKRVISFAETVVPVAIAGYVLGCLYILFVNRARLPAAILSIFKNAFKIKSAAGGVGGYALGRVITSGFKRGIFSNEAGMGSAVIVNSVSNVNGPFLAGAVGMLEVFIDTVVICTLTALSLLSSSFADLKSGVINTEVSDMALVNAVFSEHLGDAGAIFIAFSVVLFAIASIIGWSYYGQRTWAYVFGEKRVKIYNVIFTAVTLIGINVTTKAVWQISDIFNALMIFPNLLAVLMLYREVKKIKEKELD